MVYPNYGDSACKSSLPSRSNRELARVRLATVVLSSGFVIDVLAWLLLIEADNCES